MADEPPVRALSIRQPYVEQILRGEKTIEYRSRRTLIRERVYLYASLTPDEGAGDLPVGQIVGTVEILDCTGDDGDFEYELGNPRRLKTPLWPTNQPQPGFWRPQFSGVPRAAPPPPLAPVKVPPALPLGTPRPHGLLSKNSALGSSLKAHQTLAVNKILEWLDAPAPRPAGYIEMPTGSGKTFAAVSALAGIVEAGLPVLWIAHNAYLLRQAREAFVSRFGKEVESRIKMFSGRAKPCDAQITLATVQTLAGSELQHLVDLVKRNRPAIVVFDEFHRSAADTWKQVVVWLKESAVPVLGLSATPTRTGDAKKKWLKDAFPAELFRVGITELIALEILAKPQILRVDVEGKKLRWTPDEISRFKKFHDVPDTVLKRLATQEKRNQRIVQALLERKELKQTIVFCCGIAHAAHLAKRFVKNGISARAVTGSAAAPENAEALEAFKKKDVRVLTSVVLLTEGVDLPTCDSVLLGRPTQSEILLKQMMGRAMRGPEMGGNKRCTIIDFVDAFENVKLARTTEIFSPRLPTPGGDSPKGRDMAVLIEIQDWIAMQAPEGGYQRELLLKEISGVLEFFDREAGVCRSVLVPKKDQEHFIAAVKQVADSLEASPEKASDALATAVETRAAYSKHLSESRVGEEAFVSVISEGTRQGQMVMHPIGSRLQELAKAASTLDPKAAGMIGGLREVIKVLGGPVPAIDEPKPPGKAARTVIGREDFKGRAAAGGSTKSPESPKPRLGTKKDMMTKAARAFLATRKAGVRQKDLITHLQSKFPDEPPNSGNFRSSVWNLDTRFPDDIYKPSHGVFRLRRFEDRKPPRKQSAPKAKGKRKYPLKTVTF